MEQLQSVEQSETKNSFRLFRERCIIILKSKFFMVGAIGSIFLTLILFIILNLLSPLPPAPIVAASEIYDINDNLVDSFFIQNRRPAELDEIPLFLRQAFLAVEDHRFYEHKGVNVGRIIKAVWHDLKKARIEQGGSTITQQLAKNIYLTNERKLSRKIKELFYAIKLEMKLTKDEIFERYLNEIYFGHGAYGVKVAADIYFDKELTELNEVEMALLAGLPKGPAYYSPYKHPKNAQERLQQTLLRMRECGYITEDQYVTYSKEKLSLPGLKTYNTAPYFMDLIQREVVKLYPDNPELLYTAGLRIESTMDLSVQKAANQAFQRGLPKSLTDANGISQPQGALVALDPNNGEIRALIGGVEFGKSQFNRAIQAKRQPGSSFKPILYAEALSQGFTLASSFDLEPKTYYVAGKRYCPTDHRNKDAKGLITLRDALASSSNVVAVKLIEKVGPKKVADLAAKLGIHSQLMPSLSLALGASEVTPLEMATAYAPLANGGIQYEPSCIRRILDREGHVIYEREVQKGTKVLDPRVSYLVTQALTGVLKSGGTAANVGHLVGFPAAGKTGTTDKNRDAWFIGYTPNLVAAVFIGFDNYERALPGAANRVAAPIWADFMATAFKGRPKKGFREPGNLKKALVCEMSGMLPISTCPTRTEYFINDTEPTETCTEHQTVEITVCADSGLVPGPYCQDKIIRSFVAVEKPVEICKKCTKANMFTVTKKNNPTSDTTENSEEKEKKKGKIRKFLRKMLGGE